VPIVLKSGNLNFLERRSHWPRRLRRRSVVAPPAEIVGSNPTWGMDVCRECFVLSGRVLCVGLITRPTECGVSLCVI